MRHLVLKTAAAESRIVVGSDLLEQTLAEASLVVVDREVLLLHESLLSESAIVPVDGGEHLKELPQAETLYHACFERALDRSSLIVGVGGGTVCDLVGFVAATYLRGVRLALAPTTLLAQVDASIGGKNGVNFSGVKNLIGTITQPELCICDGRFLATLPDQLMSEGFAEVIKHAILSKGPLLELLESRKEPLSREGLNQIVLESIAVKKEIVEADEHESGVRRKLNLGHTVGHALEISLGISHGEAVAVGTLIEMRLSERRGLISPEITARVAGLMKRYGLPTEARYSPEEVLVLARKDKKRYGAAYKMPLITEIGTAELYDIPEEELASIL